IGLPGHQWWTFWTCLVAHAAVAFGGYFLFGGWRLFRTRYVGAPGDAEEMAFSRAHVLTLMGISGVLVAVLFFNANIGMAAFAGAVILAAIRVADHEQAIRRMPWTTIVMVCGMSVLVSLLEKTHGLDL